jgi:TPP-dependent pyruvate/acetoin dehydrogenase alpha subunit
MSEVQQVLSGDAAAVDCEGLGLKQKDLERLYEAMVTTRAADQRSRRLHEDGEISFYVASRGLEAVACGAAAALDSADWLFPSQRDLGMFLLRGGSLRTWFDQLLGNAADLAKGRQLPGYASLPDGRHVAVSGRVGTQITHAAGCAMAMRARGAQACALASFGQAAVGGADFHAAMSIAASLRAPAVFLCRAEQRDVAAEVGGAATVAGRARGYGVAATRVDGSDTLAVYQAVREARETALQGGGATLIEAVVSRAALFGEGGEAADGGAAAPEDDPITRLRRFLEDSGYWDAARDDELAGRTRERLEETVAAARSESGVPARALFDDVYAELPWMLQEQRERLLGGSEE